MTCSSHIRRILLASGTVVALVFASSAQATLLTNAGFETGDFTGWTVGGNTISSGVNVDGANLSAFTQNIFDPTFQNVRSGTFAAYGIVRTSPLEQIILEQTVSVVAGQSYDVGYFVGADASNRSYGFSSGNSIVVDGTSLGLTGLGAFSTGSTSADFRHVFGTYVASASNSVTVSYTITGSGTGRAGFSFDDFYFDGAAPVTAVPEPATAFLFAGGLLGLVLARRRRAR